MDTGADPIPKDTLVMYAIYRHPLDYPDKFVCRRWLCFAGEEVPRAEVPPFAVTATHQEILLRLPAGLVLLSRCPGDPPSLVEIWL